MNVLLINPPNKKLLTVGIPIPVEKRGFYPSMGILYVAAYSQARTSHTIQVLDADLEGISFDVLEQRIMSCAPDVVGISVQTFTLIDALRTAKIVKAISADIPVVFGGIHVSLYPFETISLEEVDIAVMGEGEVSFAEMLDCLESGYDLHNVRGILFKHKGRIVKTDDRPVQEDLDSLPFPARDTTPYQKYVSLRKDISTTTMITQRGCPYNCLFCSRPPWGRKIRSHSSRYMIEEIKTCLDMGIGEFMIYDDIFTLDRQRTLDFCKGIGEQGLDIDWSINTRVDLVDRELLQAMKKAGCLRIRYGVESGSNDILENLRKKITIQQIQEAFQATQEAGIKTVAYFMIGSPGETKQHIEETIALAKKLNADFTSFSITTLYPKTDLLNLARNKGLLENDPWVPFITDPRPGFQLPLWEEHFDRKSLLKLQAMAFRKFYLRPRYILSRLSRFFTFRGFKEAVRSGVGLFLSLLRSGRET